MNRSPLRVWAVLWPLVSLAGPVAAQHLELSARAGLVLSNFRGPGAVATATAKGDFFDASTPPAFHITPYLRNPYSRLLGAGGGTGLRVQRVGPAGGLAALEVGVDHAQSHSRVDFFDGTPLLWVGPFRLTEEATGDARLRRWVVPVFVGVGHRFPGRGPWRVDALAGPELALLVGATEKGNGTHRGRYQPIETAWRIDVARAVRQHADLRVRADLTAWRHRLGVQASYAWGLTDLQEALTDFPESYVGGRIYSQTLRLGVVYQLH